jgi:hypothetical protein
MTSMAARKPSVAEEGRATSRLGAAIATAALHDAVTRFLAALDARKLPLARDRLIVAAYLRQALDLPSPVARKKPGRRSRDELPLRDAARRRYWLLSAHVRQQLMQPQTRSARAAILEVAKRLHSTPSTVRRAFHEWDALADLATDPAAYRNAVIDASKKAQAERRRKR